MSYLLKVREWVSFPEAIRLVETLTGKKEEESDLLNALLTCGAQMRSNFPPGTYIFEILSEDEEFMYRPIARAVNYHHWHRNADQIPSADGIFRRADGCINRPVKPSIPVDLDSVAWFKVAKGMLLFSDFGETETTELIYRYDGFEENGDPVLKATCWREAIYSGAILFRPKDIESLLCGELATSQTSQPEIVASAPKDKPQSKPDKLAVLNQAFLKFWSNADPLDRTTHPNNTDIEKWLIERDYSDTLAQKAATIIRPKWALTGRKPEK